jgi:hypothetical protein
MWLNKKKSMALSDTVLSELQKYKVEEADLDNNPHTRDNVIVYSERSWQNLFDRWISINKRPKESESK